MNTYSLANPGNILASSLYAWPTVQPFSLAYFRAASSASSLVWSGSFQVIVNFIGFSFSGIGLCPFFHGTLAWPSDQLRTRATRRDAFGIRPDAPGTGALRAVSENPLFWPISPRGFRPEASNSTA